MGKKPKKAGWGWWKRIGVGALGIGVVVYGLVVYKVWAEQERMLFPVFGPAYTECTDILKLGYVPMQLEGDGETVRLLWHQAKAPKGTVILYHGNGGTVCYRTFHADHLRSADWNVALVEYPGYSPGSGPVTERRLLDNSLAAYDVVAAKTKGLPIVLFGKSLGTGPATYVASNRPAAGLILHTPYPSLTAVASAVFWHLIPVGAIIRHPMRAERWAPQVKCPVLALHGDADNLILYRFGRQQAKNFKQVDFITIPGADHNTLAWKDFGLYWDSITRFCQRQLVAPGPPSLEPK